MTLIYYLKEILANHIKENGEQPMTNKMLLRMLLEAGIREEQDDDIMNHPDDHKWS